MSSPASSVIGIGRDLGRAFRERPALIIGGGVLLLVGVNVLQRREATDAAAAGEPVDPSAGLFPGVGTYGGQEIPGSGSVPFPGYPSAGDGLGVFPPDLGLPGIDLPLPGWGLSCNGEPKPAIAGLPGTWTCTDQGWQYVPPANPPSAPTSPTSPPTNPTSGVARPSGGRPQEAIGWIRVSGVPMHAKWGTWSAYPGAVSSLRSTGMTGSRYVSGPRAVYLGSDKTRRQFSVRRVASTNGTWSNWFVPAGVAVTTG